jgi:homoserine dehydrogenase
MTARKQSGSIPVKLAIIGFGNVGRAFAEQLAPRRIWLQDIFGLELSLIGVADRSGVMVNRDGLDVAGLSRLKASGGKLTEAGGKAAAPDKAIARFADAGAQIIIETLPGNLQQEGEPAISCAAQALTRGLHVVTANKAVLLYAGPRLERLAAAQGVRLGSSGATCAALPTLSFARRELVGAEIAEMRGILNGTTNYILTRISEEGLSFTAALSAAQSAGIAEPDPRYDVEGWDSAAKLLILANALMRAEAGFEQVARQGITDLPPELIEEARRVQGAIKLIAHARRRDGQIELEVAPRIVLPTESLFAVRGASKAVEFRTDLYGTLLVAGGASSRTAVAATLLKDVIQIVTGGE